MVLLSESRHDNILPLEREVLILPYARSIYDKAMLLRETGISLKQQKYVKRSISFEIRHLCDVLSPDNLIPCVSLLAMNAASDLGIDLKLMDWHDQPKFDPERKVFHLEHVNPVSMVRDRCIGEHSLDAVKDILASDLRIAWILKEEDKILRDLGYRSKRPSPEAAYAEAGIKLI